MCPILNCFGDRGISLYICKIVDRKEILRIVSNIGDYCWSDKVGRVCLVQTFSKIPPSTSVHFAPLVRTWRVAVSSASWRSFTLAITSIARSSSSSSVFTYNSQLTHHTDSHASYNGAVRRKWRTVLGAKSKLLVSEISLFRQPFAVGHVYMYSALLRMSNTMTSQNSDISSCDTLYICI